MYGHKEFHAIRKQWEGRLIRYAEQLLHDRAHAQSTVFDVFCTMITQENEGMGRPEDPGVWLFRQVRSRCMGATNDFLTAPDNVPAPGIQSDIQALSGNEQELLALRFEQEMSCTQIAEILGLTHKEFFWVLQNAEDHLNSQRHNSIEFCRGEL